MCKCCDDIQAWQENFQLWSYIGGKREKKK